ncbi:hypothetical protein ABPG72_012182 [Tetrahymena utriculariae]
MSVNKANVRHSKNFSYSNLNESNNNSSNPNILDIHEKYHVPFGTSSVSQNSTPSNSIVSNIKKVIGSNSVLLYQTSQQKKSSINGKSSPKHLNLSGNEVKMQNQTLQYFPSNNLTNNQGSKKINRKESNGSNSEEISQLNQQQLFVKQQAQVNQSDQMNNNEENSLNSNVITSSNELNLGIAQGNISSASSNQISAKEHIPVKQQQPQFKLYSQMYEQMKQNKQASNSRIGFNQSEDLSNKFSSNSNSQSNIFSQQNQQNSNKNSNESQYQKIAQSTKQLQQNMQKNSSYSPENKKPSSPMIKFNYQSVMAVNQKNLKQSQLQNSQQQTNQQSVNNDSSKKEQSQSGSKGQSMNSSLQLKRQSGEQSKLNIFSDAFANQPSSPMKNIRSGGQKPNIGESKSTKHSQSNSKEHSQFLAQTQQNQFFFHGHNNQNDGRVYSSTPSHSKQIQYIQQQQNNQIQSDLTTSNSQSDLLTLNPNQLQQIPNDDTNASSPLIKSVGSGKLGSNQRKEFVKQHIQLQQQIHPFHRQAYSVSNIKVNQTLQLNQSQQQVQEGYLQQFSKDATRNQNSQPNSNSFSQIKRNQSNPKQILNISINNTSAVGNNTFYMPNNTYTNLTNLSTTNAANQSKQSMNCSHLKQNIKNTTNIKNSEVSLEQMKRIYIPTTGDQIKNYNSYMSNAQSKSPSKNESKAQEYDNINFVTGQTSKGDEDRQHVKKEIQLRDMQNYWLKLIQLNNNSQNLSVSNILEKKKPQLLMVQGKGVQETIKSFSSQNQGQFTSRKLVAYENGIKQITEYDSSLKNIVDQILLFNQLYLNQVPNLIQENEKLKQANKINLEEISELKQKVAMSDSIMIKLKKDLTKCEQQLANYTTQTSLNQEQLIVLSGEKSPVKLQQNQQLLAENQNLQMIIQQQQNEIEQYKEREHQIRELLIEFNKKGLIQIDVNGDALIRSIHHNPESEDNQSGNREEYKLCKKNLKELLKEQKGNNSINGDHLADDSRISDSQESSFGFIGKVTLQQIETQQELEKQQSESPINKQQSPKKVDGQLKEKLKLNMAQVQETQKLIIQQQAIQEQNEKEMQMHQQLLKQQEAAQIAQQNQIKQQQKGGKLKTQNVQVPNQILKNSQQICLPQQNHQPNQQQIQQSQQFAHTQQFNKKYIQQQQQQYQAVQQQQQLQQQNHLQKNPNLNAIKIIQNSNQISGLNSLQSEEIIIRDLAHIDNSNIEYDELAEDQLNQQYLQDQLQIIQLHQQQLNLQNIKSNQQNTPCASGSGAGESFISSGNGVKMPKPNMQKLQLNNLQKSVSPPKQIIASQENGQPGAQNKPIINKIEIEDSSGMGFHDEFMSRLDEFSLSWRKAAERERKPHTQF